MLSLCCYLSYFCVCILIAYVFCFSAHSLKRTGCVRIAENCMEKLSTHQVLSLSVHKKVVTFNGYCQNGKISKKQAIRKRDDILSSNINASNQVRGAGSKGGYGPVHSASAPSDSVHLSPLTVNLPNVDLPPRMLKGPKAEQYIYKSLHEIYGNRQ